MDSNNSIPPSLASSMTSYESLEQQSAAYGHNQRSYSDLLDSPEDRTSAWLRVYHHVELPQDGGKKHLEVMPLPGLLF